MLEWPLEMMKSVTFSKTQGFGPLSDANRVSSSSGGDEPNVGRRWQDELSDKTSRSVVSISPA